MVIAVLVAAAGLTSQLYADEERSAAEAIASAVPDTEIFLVQVDVAGRTVAPDTLRNLTSRLGYDNQPAFIAKGRALLFSSIRDGLQSDVYRLDTGTGTESRLTETAESEYSPTPLADGRFSVVRVESDGSQRLWLYSAEGKPLERLVPAVDNVGYHTWISGDRLALFLVEDPVRLVEAHLDSMDQRELAISVGRSFPMDKRSGRLYALQLRADSGADIVSRDMSGGDGWTVRGKAPDGSQDMATGPAGDIWMADGKRLLVLPEGESDWLLVADFGGRVPGPIGRLAFSSDFASLALVVTMPGEVLENQE